MNQEFLAGAEGVNERNLILQLSLVAVILIGAGLGLMMLG
jgi:hypothetical protein